MPLHSFSVHNIVLFAVFVFNLLKIGAEKPLLCVFIHVRLFVLFCSILHIIFVGLNTPQTSWWHVTFIFVTHISHSFFSIFFTIEYFRRMHALLIYSIYTFHICICATIDAILVESHGKTFVNETRLTIPILHNDQNRFE